MSIVHVDAPEHSSTASPTQSAIVIANSHVWLQVDTQQAAVAAFVSAPGLS